MRFKDVDLRHRYFKEISRIVDKGIMEGDDTGNFCVDGHITIAGFFRLVYTILECGSQFPPKVIDEFSKETEKHHWAEPYISYCRSHHIEYSYRFSIDSPLVIDEALNIMDSLAKALSIRFNLTFNCNRAAFIEKYHCYNIQLDITRTQVACLLYWFCENIGNQILANDEHILNESLFIATNQAHFFLDFVTPNKSNNSELIKIANLLNSHQCFRFDMYESMKSILHSKNNILQTLLYTDSNCVYHYTTLSTLKSLAPNNFGFRLSNAAFLNDPTEGKLLIQEFQKRFFNRLTFSYENYFPLFHTYLASFTLQDDSLPMWFQYGDKAAGCAIGFNPQSFKLPIYRVQYNLTPFEPLFMQIDTEFQKYTASHVCTVKGTPLFDILFTYVSICLEEICYLYKDSHYEHEAELRVILPCPPQFASKEDFPREGELFPRTFVNIPYKISTVTFGVNVIEPQKLAVGFSSIGLNCSFRRSNIPFRN